MINRILNYFSYTKGERNGVVVLLMLLAILMTFYIAIPYFVTPAVLSEKEMAEVHNLIASIESSGELAVEKPIERFLFNPNNLSEEKWLALGLSKRQVRMIHNYETKGGSFQVKSDVAKIYAIDSVLYTQLYPYIDLPKTKAVHSKKEKNKPKSYEKYSYTKVQVVPFEINTADTAEFKRLKGIGEVLSVRIVKYRNALGGFHSKEQLVEVYGVDEDVLVANKSLLLIDIAAVVQLNLNTATKEELAHHPYISWKAAKLIDEYRAQHGDYNHTMELLNIVIFDDIFVEKLTPYIVVE